ncbi:MAG: transposase, partial [Pseudomonadota bacterium]
KPTGRGGARPGAGRKPGKKRRVAHRIRGQLSPHHPVHVTLKIRRELRNLRHKKRGRAIRQALVRCCQRDGFRIVQWSIQHDHLHLIVEADSQPHLSSGIQGLSVSIARRLNKLAGRAGAVFADRFHAHVLKTPREVRNALSYVLNNFRHHAAQTFRKTTVGVADKYSSWAWFDGWKDISQATRTASRGEDPPPVARANRWLLTTGWRKRGLIRVDEVPGKLSAEVLAAFA